ncbi:MAG TPA: FlgD immunoglobulin-like domain containing protein [Candidatus Edwardsbacteria bacterium]|nr:FlgD immunoglobulin-like domain containing protein [Candidatus Edwardsbacteria bacterium]
MKTISVIIVACLLASAAAMADGPAVVRDAQGTHPTGAARPGHSVPAAAAPSAAAANLHPWRARSDGRPHDGASYGPAKSYLEDFRVNQEDTPQDFDHLHPGLAASYAPMRVWVAWQDGRSYNGDIYLQRYNSAMVAVGGNIRVNDDSLGQLTQNYPQVACDSAGNALVVWYDTRWAFAWGQRFDSAGVRQGTNFKLFPDSMNGYVYDPAVAMMPNGAAVVCGYGYNYNMAHYVIVAQRFDSSGAMSGPPIYVDTATTQKYDAACGICGSRTVFAWFDYRNGRWGIYARVYDAAGNPLTSAIPVTDSTAGPVDAMYHPALAVGDSGQFAVSWADQRYGTWDIFVRRYDCDGAAADTTVMANTAATSQHYFPQLNYARTGYAKDWLVASWLDYRSGASLYGQQFSPTGALAGEFQYLGGAANPNGPHATALCFIGSGYSIPVAWQDMATAIDNNNIDCLDRNTAWNPVKCNSDNDGANQVDPAIAADDSGRFLAIWTDTRATGGGATANKIYARPFRADGTPIIAVDFLADDTLTNYMPEQPAAACNAAGDFICLWQEYRSVWGLTGTIAAGPPAGAFRISADSNHYWCNIHTAAAIDDSGRFLAAWQDGRNGNSYDLYCRGFGKGRTALLSYDLRLNSADGAVQSKPGVADCRNGRFVVVYNDSAAGGTILGQLVQLGADTVTLAGPAFLVSDSGVSNCYGGAAAADSAGNFCVAWYDQRTYLLRARWFDRNGVPADSSFAISADYSYPNNSGIAVDRQGRMIATWGQYDVSWINPDVMARAYGADRTPYTPIFQVDQGFGTGRTQNYPAVAAGGGKFYLDWLDCRYDTCGTDIFAKGYTWSDLGVAGRPAAGTTAGRWSLGRPYPNPSAGQSTISYQLAAASQVELRVYNVAGQQVRTLVDARQPAGAHAARWDGRNDAGRRVAGGVYLVRLHTEGGDLTGRLTLVR